jgi:hypothetical protein
MFLCFLQRRAAWLPLEIKYFKRRKRVFGRNIKNKKNY